ncbi:MAG TPA: ATP-binding cassette domain-containing protein, partial [Chitinivibrionales bacterium]
WPIMATGWVFNIFQRGLASVKRLMELLEVKSDVLVFSQNAALFPKIRGDIRLKNLSFSFTEGKKEVLRNIDLTIPSGGSLGIVGKPGSGKTTLACLLFHLFPVKRDSLFIDGLDINDIPLDTLRSCIGYVPQDSFLFSDTIAQNIAFGLPEGPNHGEAIRRFARIAAIEKEIEAFPQGFETMVGERGITLSGGQKQRIAIARALMIKPPILIFDDALSAIDAGTEREIKTNMQRETSGKTTIIIAHRISTVMGCDTILVLDSGAIAEQGAHEELIAHNGFYAKLFMLQKLRGTEQ